MRKKIIFISIFIFLVTGAVVLFFYSQKAAPLPEIRLRIDSENCYSLFVDGKPYLVKGVCYLPTPAGQFVDFNFWANDHIWKTDGKLMKAMGVNTVRFYRPGKVPHQVRRVVGGLFERYNIRSLMGHDLGFWDWPPPNYALESFREKIKADVIEMVKLYQHEPGILAWILGNENNYSFEIMNVQSWTTPELEKITDTNKKMREKARIYYSLVDEIAEEIKKIDPVRPVIMGIGEVRSLDIAKEICTHVDILGPIVYRGPGFGSLFRQIRMRFDLPVLLIEWGADSFNALTQKEDQDKQEEYIRLQWRDIQSNAIGGTGECNCLGGTLFEWSDEWWKGNAHVESTWNEHDTTGQFSNSAYYDFDHAIPGHLNMNEEWWGVVGIEPKTGKQGVDQRRTRKVYKTLQKTWGKN